MPFPLILISIRDTLLRQEGRDEIIIIIKRLEIAKQMTVGKQKDFICSRSKLWIAGMWLSLSRQQAWEAMFCPILLSPSPSYLPAWVHTALNSVKIFLRLQYSCNKLCQVYFFKRFSTAFIKKKVWKSIRFRSKCKKTTNRNSEVGKKYFLNLLKISWCFDIYDVCCPKRVKIFILLIFMHT